MEFYDKAYDRVTTKSEKKLRRINRIFHKITTTDDPVIRQVYIVKGSDCLTCHLPQGRSLLKSPEIKMS